MNREKLVAAITWAEENPNCHDQGEWASTEGGGALSLNAMATMCGTTACLAGIACMQDGAVLDPYSQEAVYGDRIVSIEEGARDALGLTQYEARTLFLDCRDLDDIKAVVSIWTGGELYPEHMQQPTHLYPGEVATR
ncbi:hypothetical protein [Frankia sp. Cj3]|uniref:hypothetical protein n=1 Tax=Frankia sp. Cj3 TaxID=2880976 RepID=UPI001EF50B12|nr:hypothetical protein [Frankia sp. Cj3]